MSGASKAVHTNLRRDDVFALHLSEIERARLDALATALELTAADTIRLLLRRECVARGLETASISTSKGGSRRKQG